MPNYRKMKAVMKWEFPPSKKWNDDGTLADPWTVVKWEDGTFSCNCPIWCQNRQKDAQGKRSCKHLRGVLIQLAMENPSIANRKWNIDEGGTPSPSKHGRRQIILEDD